MRLHVRDCLLVTVLWFEVGYNDMTFSELLVRWCRLGPPHLVSARHCLSPSRFSSQVFEWCFEGLHAMACCSCFLSNCVCSLSSRFTVGLLRLHVRYCLLVIVLWLQGGFNAVMENIFSLVGACDADLVSRIWCPFDGVSVVIGFQVKFLNGALKACMQWLVAVALYQVVFVCYQAGLP